MGTLLLLNIIWILAILIIPWVGYLNQHRMRPVDLMAGDEGED